MTGNYVLERGDRGAARLEILAEAANPSTLALLERIGIAPGWRCLDVGCGIGAVSAWLFERTGRVWAVDDDRHMLSLARRRVPGGNFHPLDARQIGRLGQRFDLVYARYLLSHQADPAAVLERMVAGCRPGGWVVLEDVDFPGHFWYPACRAMERYLELYQAVVRRRGGNPCLGRELVGMMAQAGLEHLQVNLVTTIHPDGRAKQVAEVTLEHIGQALVEADLARAEEVDDLVAELRRFRELPTSQISIAPTFQVVGRKAT